MAAKLKPPYRLLLTAIAWGALAAFAWRMVRSRSAFDDAYVYLRYAKHLLAGMGPAWNPGEGPVYGFTSSLYLALVTALRALLDAGDAAILNLASGGAATAGVALLALVCRRHLSAGFLRLPYAVWLLLALYALGLWSALPYHARTGMDTTLAFACNALLVLATLEAARAPRWGRAAALVLAGYLSFAARPDNLLYALLLPPLFLVLAPPRRRRLAAVYVLGLGALLALDTLVKWRVFGDPLPLSFHAKTAGYYEGYLGAHQWNPMLSLTEVGETAVPFLLLIVIFVTRRSAGLAAAFLLPVVLTYGYFFTVVQIMGYRGRFYLPALPLVIVGALLVLDRFLRPPRPPAPWTRATAGWNPVRLALVPILLLATARPIQVAAIGLGERWLVSAPAPRVAETVYRTAAGAPPPRLERWPPKVIAALAAALPAGTRISLSEHGLVGAAAPHVSIDDPVGLHDPVFARRGFSAEALLARRPSLVWLPHPHYSKLVAELLDSETLWRDYDVYPGAFDYGLAVRRDDRARVRAPLEAAWRRSYGALEIARFRASR